MLFTLGCKTHSNQKEMGYSISGKVTKSNLYCGGTRPTQEMIARYKIPKVYSNKSFYIKNKATDYTNEKTISQFVTDSLGRFKINLNTGTYSIFLNEQINTIDFSESKKLKLEQACYDDWLTKPYSIIEVKKENIDSLKFHFTKKCFVKYDIPCLQYIGPRPQ